MYNTLIYFLLHFISRKTVAPTVALSLAIVFHKARRRPFDWGGGGGGVGFGIQIYFLCTWDLISLFNIRVDSSED